MNSTKTMLLIVTVAVIGAFLFAQLDLTAAFAFIAGVIATFLVFTFSSTSAQIENENGLDSDINNSTKTLYVGNLPYKANEMNVKELFAQYGEVFAVRLMKDKRTGKRRGFGFVVMAAGDAQPAIEALNEKEYMQRTLKVRIANDPKHPQEDRDEQD
ncbi:RNA recognition motif domain-containing protein [Vibrio sp.]|uniref:RNA recognition motif domain-containing protein n=1 Tax=Vibrio sp. TaxID=678 RepID=UPI003D141CAD